MGNRPPVAQSLSATPTNTHLQGQIVTATIYQSSFTQHFQQNLGKTNKQVQLCSPFLQTVQHHTAALSKDCTLYTSPAGSCIPQVSSLSIIPNFRWKCKELDKIISKTCQRFAFTIEVKELRHTRESTLIFYIFPLIPWKVRMLSINCILTPLFFPCLILCIPMKRLVPCAAFPEIWWLLPYDFGRNPENTTRWLLSPSWLVVATHFA